MLKISGPVGAAAFVSVFLLSGTDSGLSIDIARADACLAAPKSVAPGGQHWYFHVDRATRRKCWYLHAVVPLGHRAMIRHEAAEAAAPADAAPLPEAQTAAEPQTVAAPAPVAELPDASAAAPAPATQDATDNTPPAPHVTVLAVRPATPFVSTTAASQQDAAQQSPASPTPQTAPHDEGTPAADGGKPADAPQSVQSQDKADTAFSAPVQAADAATESARTKTAEMFILLALVFGVAAAVVALVSKILGMYRRPRISDDPDAAWLSYRAARQRIDAEAQSDEQGVPYLDPQEHYGLADLQAQEWLDRYPPGQGDELSVPSHRSADFTQPQSGAPNLKGIEPALRALRQARQN
jgi:hypothetical protein